MFACVEKKTAYNHYISSNSHQSYVEGLKAYW